jgi:hypothetical protein
MTFSKKRQQVMFAQTEKIDVADNNHFIVLNGIQSAIDQVINILLIAFCEKRQRVGHTLGRFFQTTSLGILAKYRQELGDQAFEIRRGPLFECSCDSTNFSFDLF